MKRFSKVLMSVAAVTAVTAAMAVSASAMTASYADGTVTLGAVTATGTSQTLLVVAGEAGTVASETTIKQIDQKDDSTSFVSVPVGTLADGTYEVRVGGDGTIQTATFKVGAAETEDIIIGDVDLNGTVVAGDATMLARQQAKLSTGIGKVGTTRVKADDSSNVIIGDVDLNGTVVAGDATMLARQQAKLSTGTGKVGETISVNK